MTKDKILQDIKKKWGAKIRKRKVAKIFKKIRIFSSISEKVIINGFLFCSEIR